MRRMKRQPGCCGDCNHCVPFGTEDERLLADHVGADAARTIVSDLGMCDGAFGATMGLTELGGECCGAAVLWED